MHLLDLNPLWLYDTDLQLKIGFMFISPLNRKFYQTCFFRAMRLRLQCEAVMRSTSAYDETDWNSQIQYCEDTCGWQWNGQGFASLTIMPSLDGSKGGLWHGHIINGQLQGGGV